MAIIRFLCLWVCLTLSLQAAPPAGYTLVFHDEFDGPLSIPGWTGWDANPPTKWICHTPFSGDFGEAWFSGPGEPNTANPFSISGGQLIITAWKDPLRNNHWRSGLLASINSAGIGFQSGSRLLGMSDASTAWSWRLACFLAGWHHRN